MKYQIVKNGEIKKWVALNGNKLVEIDTFDDYAEARRARKMMENAYMTTGFEIVTKRA